MGVSKYAFILGIDAWFKFKTNILQYSIDLKIRMPNPISRTNIQMCCINIIIYPYINYIVCEQLM